MRGLITLRRVCRNQNILPSVTPTKRDQIFNGDGEPSNIVFVHAWLGGSFAHPRGMVGLLAVAGARLAPGPPTIRFVVEGPRYSRSFLNPPYLIR